MPDFKFSGDVKGSPPRMRGKLCRHGQTRRHDGITPADAGKTIEDLMYGRKITDHPRGCGENLSATVF